MYFCGCLTLLLSATGGCDLNSSAFIICLPFPLVTLNILSLFCIFSVRLFYGVGIFFLIESNWCSLNFLNIKGMSLFRLKKISSLIFFSYTYSCVILSWVSSHFSFCLFVCCVLSQCFSSIWSLVGTHSVGKVALEHKERHFPLPPYWWN